MNKETIIINCRAALQDGRNSKSIAKQTEFDADVLATFRGPGKEDAFSAWVNANYPGYIYAPHSGAIKQPSDIGSKVKKSNKEKSFGTFFKPKESKKEKPSNPTQNKAEKKVANAQAKYELRDLKRKYTRQQKDDLNQSYLNKPKNAMYYLRLLWIYLDSPWKKAVVIILVLSSIGGVYQYGMDKITYSSDLEMYKQEDQRLTNIAFSIDSLINIGQFDEGLILLPSLDWELKIKNQFLKDSVRKKDNHWSSRKRQLDKILKSTQ